MTSIYVKWIGISRPGLYYLIYNLNVNDDIEEWNELNASELTCIVSEPLYAELASE